MNRLNIATRGSELALWQAEWVKERLVEIHPDLEVSIVKVETEGDRDLESPLPLLEGKGAFTAELERGLREGSVDLAVHSLKDLPADLPEGLKIGAYCQRHDPRDAFLGKEGLALAQLAPGARIGTSSLRRSAQVRRFRPDLECVNIRGNLATRWRKLAEDELMDGIILAAAGVSRLGWRDRVTEYLPCDVVMPAAGQGAIAVEIAEGRADVARLVQPLNHADSERAVRAERRFLEELGGGCQVPIGALAVCNGRRIMLAGTVCSLDGRKAVTVKVDGDLPEQVGIEAARSALDRGAAEILAGVAAKPGTGEA